MQITRVVTGAGMPHGIGHSNSWKYFSISGYSGTIHQGKCVYYSCSSKLSFEERKSKSLGEKAKARKLTKLMETIEISNVRTKKSKKTNFLCVIAPLREIKTQKIPIINYQLCRLG